MHNETAQQEDKVDIRELLREAIAHMEHVLPGQAPIRDFVHHNTLHGYQHLTFPQALKASRETTGASAYLPEKRYREYFQQGRINLHDLEQVLQDDEKLNVDTVIIETEGMSLRYRDIHLASLLYPLKPVTGCQLNWHIEELGALRSFQQDVAAASREKLLGKTGGSEAESIEALWAACLKALRLQHFILHPEELIDLDPERAREILHEYDEESDEAVTAEEPTTLHRDVHKEARNLLGQLVRQVGHDFTMRSMLQALTGEDILDDIRPTLLRHVSNYLDQGMSAWHSKDRTSGFFAAWRSSAVDDLNWIFEGLPEWQDSLHSLPDDAMETIIGELTRLGIPESHWTHYLQRLALEIPGWSGMFLWRHLHPGYEQSTYPVDMVDYLAVRLVLERLFAQRLCRQHWQLEANLDVLRWYFRRRRSEFYCRYQMFNTQLPEYLVSQVQKQLQRTPGLLTEYQPWKHVSDMIISWKHSPMSDRDHGYSVRTHGWQLFRLAQHLGLSADDICRLDNDQISTIFDCLQALDEESRGFIWLQAYERHYRDELFHAVVDNQNRGRWAKRDTRPEAQVVFCMDDREEGIRRHLEELNPEIETMGAAGFFGVAVNWKGLDDKTITPLCPVVVTPAHELREQPRDDNEIQLGKHRTRLATRLWLKDLFNQETRRSLLSPLLIAVAAPLSLLSLLAKTFIYRHQGKWLDRLREKFDLPVPTRVAINAGQIEQAASPEHPQPGFTDEEQVARVENFLRTIGLNQGFGSFVVLMGHGSSSQNNPHLAAYDCGACSGRHGGPNARIFAALANRPEIRELLKQRGLDIPSDTLFLGAEHDTCDEVIYWYDTDLIPAQQLPAFETLKHMLTMATYKSAHERCRRLASAPKQSSLKKALHHITGRAYDFSQARPELGHATNAAAFIGRRSLSQGMFFDRRVFLISYDPTQDDDRGSIIENILLNAGPVGAGINLEYYFSTVNNDEYGSGSKITHNVSGLFGVMDGTSGDLRTGLPLQMIEIHEAMRLQVLVEASTEVLTEIYLRQPPLQELVGNGWLLLSAKDPHSEQISVFIPGRGFVPWQGPGTDLPEVDESADWYAGHTGPLSPARIRQQVQHV